MHQSTNLARLRSYSNVVKKLQEMSAFMYNLFTECVLCELNDDEDDDGNDESKSESHINKVSVQSCRYSTTLYLSDARRRVN